MSKEVLLDVRHLTQQFHLTKKIKVKAVDDVSFQIHKGEIFGLVGESGSGKSTVARCLMNIYQPAQGEIWYKDVNICDKKEFKKHKKMLQTRLAKSHPGYQYDLFSPWSTSFLSLFRLAYEFFHDFFRPIDADCFFFDHLLYDCIRHILWNTCHGSYIFCMERHMSPLNTFRCQSF